MMMVNNQLVNSLNQSDDEDPAASNICISTVPTSISRDHVKILEEVHRVLSKSIICVQMTIYYIYIYLVGCDIICIYTEVYSEVFIRVPVLHQ